MMRPLSARAFPEPALERRTVFDRLVLEEYLYYGLMAYALIAPALGISAGLVGAATLALLAFACVWRVGLAALPACRPIFAALLCGASVVAIQLFVHGESLMHSNVRAFVTWMLGLVTVQLLCLRRGFFHRFAIAAFLVGLATLPFLRVYTGTETLERAGLDRSVAVANPNDLAAWFGFYAVYFFVAGFEQRRDLLRIAAWALGVGCLYVVGLTVSRGPLFAVAVAGLFAFRRVLKRGFVPLLLLLALLWFVFESGLFDRILEYYRIRMGQETGRLVIWPVVATRILDALAFGVGVSEMATYAPGSGNPITPHNSFLLIGLISGFLPLALFTGYWARAFYGALRGGRRPTGLGAFYVPMVVYAFLIAFQLNAPFMFQWMIVVLGTAVAETLPQSAARVVLKRIPKSQLLLRRGRWVRLSPPPRRAGGRSARPAGPVAPAPGLEG